MIQLNKLTQLRAIYRAFLFLILIPIFTPLQILCFCVNRILGKKPKRQTWLGMMFYRYLLWVLNIRLDITHRQHLRNRGTTLYLCNHIGYVDILCLGAAVNAFFVAKTEVASWPVFGMLGKLGGTIFISRARTEAKRAVDTVTKHLQHGESLMIFPEGTNTIGTHVLPFKSTMLHACQHVKSGMKIVPMTIIATHLNGRKVTRDEQHEVIGWGDMPMGAHLWRLFNQNSIRMKIIVHAPIPVTTQDDPKLLSQQCHDLVAHSLKQQLGTIHKATS